MTIAVAHLQGEIVRQIHALLVPGDELLGEAAGQRLDDRGDVVAPHRQVHVGRVAGVERRVLHAEEEVLAGGDRAHLRLVHHLEILVAVEHLDHVLLARDDRGAGVRIGRDELPGQDQIGQEGAREPQAEALHARLPQGRDRLRLRSVAGRRQDRGADLERRDAGLRPTCADEPRSP